MHQMKASEQAAKQKLQCFMQMESFEWTQHSTATSKVPEMVLNVALDISASVV